MSGFFFQISDLYHQEIKPQEKLDDISKIDFEDPDIHLDWIKNMKISQTDSDPLEVGQTLGIHGLIVTKEVPKEVVIHIFHEDMMNFFTSNEEYSFRQITNGLDKILTLRYGDAFHIKFDLSGDDVRNGTESFSLNGFETYTFQKEGTYFAIVSMKTQDEIIVHYVSSSSILKIKEIGNSWINTTLGKLVKSSEQQKVEYYSALGITVLATGFSLLFIGISFLLSSSEGKKFEFRIVNPKRLILLIFLPALIWLGLNVISYSSGKPLTVIIMFLAFIGMFVLHYAFPKTHSSS